MTVLRITDIRVGDITLPPVRPFKTALRTVDAVNGVVVRVPADEGAVGCGEARPSPAASAPPFRLSGRP